MACDDLHRLVPGFIARTWSQGPLFGDRGPGGFIQPEHFPSSRFVADATASDLPHPHDGIVLLCEANGVDLDITSVAVISKLKDVP